jgi:hypothetical protein
MWQSSQGSGVALTMMASIPRGCHQVVKTRDAMNHLILGKGWSTSSWCPPTVDHPSILLLPANFGPRAIFVGYATEWLQNSPWCDPCSVCHVFDNDMCQITFASYCNLRADLREFLLL